MKMVLNGHRIKGIHGRRACRLAELKTLGALSLGFGFTYTTRSVIFFVLLVLLYFYVNYIEKCYRKKFFYHEYSYRFNLFNILKFLPIFVYSPYIVLPIIVGDFPHSVPASKVSI